MEGVRRKHRRRLPDSLSSFTEPISAPAEERRRKAQVLELHTGRDQREPSSDPNVV